MTFKNHKNYLIHSSIYQHLYKRNIKVILLMLLFLTILLCIDLSIGSYNITIYDYINIIFGRADQSIANIIINLRLPHVLCAILYGSIMGICGCMLQSLLANPLATPSTIGVSQGAACGACISVAFLNGLFIISSDFILILLAFIFAMIPATILFLMHKLNKIESQSIILAGFALSTFFTGTIAIVEYFSDASKIAEIVYWTFGSVYNANYFQLMIMLLSLLLCLVYGIYNSITLNAISCGDIIAHSAGINVYKKRIINLVICALCSATATAFCGTINFVGLIAPHIMKRIIGENHLFLVPTSAICGSCIVCFSDIISSCIIPGMILPIGAITSFIGAPFFIYILISKNHYEQ